MLQFMGSKRVGHDWGTELNSTETRPTRLLCPWNSPGKNIGVGSHSLLQVVFFFFSSSHTRRSIWITGSNGSGCTNSYNNNIQNKHSILSGHCRNYMPSRKVKGRGWDIVIHSQVSQEYRSQNQSAKKETS